MPSSTSNVENSVALESMVRLGSFRTLSARGSRGTDEAYRYTVGFPNDSCPYEKTLWLEVAMTSQFMADNREGLAQSRTLAS
jgi:hypothetical protein